MKKTTAGILFGMFYLSGIFINNILGNIYISLLIFLLLSVIFFIYIFYKKNYGYLAIISLFGLIIGIYVSDYNLEKVEKNIELINHFNSKESFNIKINKINKITEENIIYTGKLISISDYKIKENINLEVSIKGNKQLEKGTIINYESKIYKYKPFNNFQYDKYMYSNGIYFRTYPYTYEIIGYNSPNIIEKKILDIRSNILKSIKNIYTKDESIFLGGILVGAREDMPEKLKGNFNNSGLTHIIAVSGFNITIIIVFLGYLIKSFPPYIRFIIITISIILFTILVGYNPPVIRASIMGIIGYFVLISGRKGNILAILILTAALMITYSPLSINYDISTHLSFLAVLGIIFTNDFFEKKLKFIPNFLEIRNALSLTLSALLFTFPIMIFNFGQISIVAPLSNILVSWTIPIIMLFSIIGLFFYYLLPTLGIIISFLPWLLLKWDIFIVNTFGTLKFSTIQFDLGKYSSYLKVMCFIIIFYIVYLLYKNKESK